MSVLIDKRDGPLRAGGLAAASRSSATDAPLEPAAAPRGRRTAHGASGIRIIEAEIAITKPMRADPGSRRAASVEPRRECADLRRGGRAGAPSRRRPTKASRLSVRNTGTPIPPRRGWHGCFQPFCARRRFWPSQAGPWARTLHRVGGIAAVPMAARSRATSDGKEDVLHVPDAARLNGGCRHCEERSDEAIQLSRQSGIASLRSQ